MNPKPCLLSCSVCWWRCAQDTSSYGLCSAFKNTVRCVHREGAEAWIWSVIHRYSIHLWDLNHEGTWENKSSYIYYTDFIMELAILCLDLMHHIHMLVRNIPCVAHQSQTSLEAHMTSFLFSRLRFVLRWEFLNSSEYVYDRVFLFLTPLQLFGNIWLSMASLVIFMQLRYLFHEVQRRIRRHKNYLRVIDNMESRWGAECASDLLIKQLLLYRRWIISHNC